MPVNVISRLKIKNSANEPIAEAADVKNGFAVVADSAARDAILSSVKSGGFLVFRSDTSGLEWWNGSTWNAIATGGGGGRSLRYTYSTITTDADPGAGTLRGNNATLSSVTTFFIDLSEFGGTDATAWIDSFDDTNGGAKGVLRLQSLADSTKWIEYLVTGWTTATGYRKLSVTYLAGPGGLSTTAGDTSVSFDAIGYTGTVPISSGGTGLTSISAANRVLASTNGTTYTTTQIVDAMVATGAAIDGAKISPNFGSQNVTTTGTLASGAATITGDITLAGAARTIGYASTSTASATGLQLTVSAQTATGLTSTGGKLALASGGGTSNDGDVEITRGAATSVFLATTANTVVRSASNVLVSINGVTRIQVTSSVIAVVVSDFRFDTATTNPVFRQNPTSTASTTGQRLTVAAQDATGATSTGGDLDLRPGAGTTAGGTGNLKTGGGTARFSWNDTGIGFGVTPIAKPTVTGSRGGNAALASALTALANLGLLTDSSS